MEIESNAMAITQLIAIAALIPLLRWVLFVLCDGGDVGATITEEVVMDPKYDEDVTVDPVRFATGWKSSCTPGDVHTAGYLLGLEHSKFI